jgi:hypothetical protein
MTDQKAIRKPPKAIRHFCKTAGQAIRKVFSQKRSEKRSESDQKVQKNFKTAGQAIRKISEVSDRLAIRKTLALYIKKGQGSVAPGANQ